MLIKHCFLVFWFGVGSGFLFAATDADTPVIESAPPSVEPRFYVQWGYNRDWYSTTDIHFKGTANDIEHDFTVHGATAHDRPDFDSILSQPWDVTIPQYNIRVGYYLRPDRSEAVEINFDHSKYVVDDNQEVLITGTINGESVNETRSLDPVNFVHFEHTNGANFLHVNYARFWDLRTPGAGTRGFMPLSKVGAGIVIPKTDVTLFGKRLDNRFHIAGYIASMELGSRYYFLERWFLEAIGKGGWARYAYTLTVDEAQADHSFGYFSAILTAGWEF